MKVTLVGNRVFVDHQVETIRVALIQHVQCPYTKGKSDTDSHTEEKAMGRWGRRS